MKFNQLKGGKTDAVFLLGSSLSHHWYRHLRSAEFDCTLYSDEISHMEI